MIKGVKTAILVSSSISSRESGREILKILLDAAPRYSPELFNNYEPINLRFDPDDLAVAVSSWEFPFLWRHKRQRLSGSAWFGIKGAHDAIQISMPLRAFDLAETLCLFEALDAAFGTAIAYIHVTTDSDTDDRENYTRHVKPFQCLTTHGLREGLPGLSWAMWFGQPYRELFGESLLDVPAFSVREIGSGVYVQLTEKITDVDRQREAYLEAQANAQAHLNNDAFRGNPSGKCRVPEFQVPRP